MSEGMKVMLALICLAEAAGVDLTQKRAPEPKRRGQSTREENVNQETEAYEPPRGTLEHPEPSTSGA